MGNRIFVFIVLAVLIFILFTVETYVSAKKYQPEISGNFETGDRLYTDPGSFNWDYPNEDDFVDYFKYNKQWLKYKQKLAPYEYYYIKLQRYERKYDMRETYDNISYKMEGNYTFYLKEGLRNRIKIMLRDKDYNTAENKSYQVARINYSWQFSFNKAHDYEIFLQKQWTKYNNKDNKDYDKDRIGINWGWKINPDFDIDTKFQIERQLHGDRSLSTDKYAKKIAISFKYKL